MQDPVATPLTTLVASIDPDDHPGRIIERVMASARDHLGLQVSFVSEFEGGQRIFRYAGGEVERFEIAVEGAEPLEETYCQRVVAGIAPPIINDPKTNPATASMPVTEALGVEVYVGVPVERSDGSIFGTLCCLSTDPEDAVPQRDLVFMRMAAAIVAEQIEREEMAGAPRRAATQRIRHVIDRGAIEIVLQPIVTLADGHVLGYEALARFPDEPKRPTHEWFHEAWSVGLGVDLELAALDAATALVSEIPAGAYLAVNVSAETLLVPSLVEILEAVAAERVVLEITEHAHVFDYAPVRERLDALREQGFRIAVDDLGTGHAGISHLLQFQPDILKIDLSVVQGVRRDPFRRAIASTLATLAANIGASIVAEGIETADDHEALEILGLTAGQGYYIAPPAALDKLPQLHVGGM